MKKLLSTLICILLISFSNGWAIDLPLPSEPPIQVSGVEIRDGYTALAWDANTESDLAGYIVFYSVNTAGFIYDKNKGIDVGNATLFKFTDLPTSTGKDGDAVFFGLAAYDTIGNVSGITSKTDSGGDIGIFFVLNRPPVNPSGGRLEQ